MVTRHFKAIIYTSTAVPIRTAIMNIMNMNKQMNSAKVPSLLAIQELHCFSEWQRSEWQRFNSPPSLTWVTVLFIYMYLWPWGWGWIALLRWLWIPSGKCYTNSWYLPQAHGVYTFSDVTDAMRRAWIIHYRSLKPHSRERECRWRGEGWTLHERKQNAVGKWLALAVW